MYNFAKRVTSAVVAGAVVLGTLAFYPGWNKGKVNAATKYDSASAINYATVLGGAVDYGVVADTIIQTNHTETTFATNHYIHNSSDSVDVDYVYSTALFLIGKDLTTTSGATSQNLNITFGKTTASAIYLEAPETVYGPNDYASTSRVFNPSINAKQNVQNGNIWFGSEYSPIENNPPFIQAVNADASSNVNRLINRICKDGPIEDAEKGWAYFLQDRANDPAYRLDTTDTNIVDRTSSTSKVTIDLTNSTFDGKVVYININAASGLLKYIQESGSFIIKKNESSVVVINIEDDAYTGNELILKKPVVIVNGSEYTGDTVSKGGDPVGAAAVQKYYNQSIIWNIMEKSDIQLEDFGGAILCPETQNVSLSGGNSSGWVVTPNKFTMSKEFHFLYQGASKDSYGQMHFALTKAFTNDYAPHTKVVQNTSVTIPNDSTYKFYIQEYEHESSERGDFTGAYGIPQEAKAKTNGEVIFPILSFTCTDSSSHYYVPKPAAIGETSEKMFYFRITEDQNSHGTNVTNSNGYIDVRLKVAVNSSGHFTYFVDYKAVTGDGIVFRDYGEDYSNFIKMSGVQFDLGQFFNKVDSSLVIEKKVTGSYNPADDEYYAFTVLGADNKYYDQDGAAYDSQKVVLVPANGKLSLTGLPAQEYTITEVDTPDNPINRTSCTVDTSYSNPDQRLQ